jgi:hypothetical protein
MDLSSQYIDKVIEVLLKDTDNLELERRKEVKTQVSALRNLELVMTKRLQPESSALQPHPNHFELRATATALAFGAGLDDDEAVLRLMHEVDKDSSGTVSEQELLDSPLLNQEESKDLKKAIQAAFGCDLTAVEEALALLDRADFGPYAAAGEANVWDRKAAVRAVFNAAAAQAQGPAASREPEGVVGGSCGAGPPSQDRLPAHGTGLGTGKAAGGTKRVTKSGLERLATNLKGGSEKLGAALSRLAEGLLREGVDLDFLAIKRAAWRVPRVSGPRVEWVSSVGLNEALARHLPAGTLEDGLAGVREMPTEAALCAFDAFIGDARVKFLAALLKAREARGSKSAAEANSKFDGFQGSFASLKDFHAGPEASLQLGYPNPNTMMGIWNEHTAHPSAERLFVTPNYRITTSLLVEYAWAALEKCPADPAAQALLARARAQLVRLAADVQRWNVVGAGSEGTDSELLFPGEVGDSFSESLVVLRVSRVGPADRVDIAKRCVDAALARARELLETEEEKTRGVSALDHAACAARIARGATVRLAPDAPNGGGAALDSDCPLLVGVMLPWSSSAAPRRAELACAALREAVAASVTGSEGVVVEAARCTMWFFRKHAGVEGLHKWLGEQSLDKLKGLIPAEAELRAKSGFVVDAQVEGMGHDALCSAIAGAFVRTELRADLRAALDHASDAQVLALLEAWRPEQGLRRGTRAEWVEQAVAALNSEQQWGEVEGWVGLHRGRIQGRTRLGLEGLMKREAGKISRYGLTDAEVLALYLYTGACPRATDSVRVVCPCDHRLTQGCGGRAGIRAD